MNNKELIEKYELELKDVQLKFGSSFKTKVYEELLYDLKQLDKPEPIKLRDVIARIKQLDIGTRKVWLDEFLNELGSDYGTLKYKDGYEQGKLDGAMEREKVTIPQFVADWLEKVKNKLFGLNYDSVPSEIYDWVYEEEGNLKKLHIACVIGYTVEKEKRYLVKMKNAYYNKYPQFLCETDNGIFWAAEIDLRKTKFTRKELEQAGFGWVFECPGIEIEEVE